MKYYTLILVLSIFSFFNVQISSEKEDCTELARDEETLLVLSTLGGGLTAIDPITNEIRWSIDDDPAVKSDAQTDLPLPQYLPDPRDGSIYQLGSLGDLKKLPYTIPQLVASAPCRSSDGILYSGKKSDVWFLIDPKTGRREKVMGFGSGTSSPTYFPNNGNNEEKIGWATSRAVYLGRTQYTVMMYDSMAKNKNTKPWNVTFYDYSSHTMAPEISNEYEYIHLAGSSTGTFVTLNRRGNFLWQLDMKTPVISTFLLAKEGLLSVPFTTVADEALNNIVEEAKDGNTNEIKLFQSLYIGEHQHGLYAIPSLVDKNIATISSQPPIKLLDGPHKRQLNNRPNLVHIQDLLDQEQKNILVLGHYEMPKTNDKNLIKITPSNTKHNQNNQLATLSHLEIVNSEQDNILMSSRMKEIGVQTETQPEINKNSTIIDKQRISKFLNDSKAWLTDEQSGGVHQILLLLILIVITMFWYMCSSLKEIRHHSQNGSQTNRTSSGSNGNVNYQDLMDLGDGEVQVGKIAFNCNQVLGKGCEGTFVFRGTFEKRDVAVKRLLPECFTFADREVALLRESDAHENVVRYFCTEQDRQFRYIAVELCAATLQDYSESQLSAELRSRIDEWEVLKQATSGLRHLHSLNIVHRDIKPQNVLLSLPDANNKIRAMISDFGLCKKLNYGKVSFSRRSGVTGTEGWIAPEMLKGQRTTTSVDIFSMGCVFYYVLSEGNHPFGDTLKRQANILSNEYDLSQLTFDNNGESKSKMILAQEVIADMLHYDAQMRPSADAICNHPIFWSENRVLSFLQDVSDRVEKLQFNMEPLKTLEKNGRFVVKEDWHLHLHTAITDDLRKYRGYMGASVRDLLRALRNKKHHYHELSLEAQNALGSIPHEFTQYWINKFPTLVSHAYHAIGFHCADENPFKVYYSEGYKFTPPNYFYMDDSEFIALNLDPKPLQKDTLSPKKIMLNNPDKYKNHQRKNYHYFRKYNLQNNIDNTDNFTRNAESIELNSTEEVKRDLFANFKFRNKNSNNKIKPKNQEKPNVTWVLPNEK